MRLKHLRFRRLNLSCGCPGRHYFSTVCAVLLLLTTGYAHAQTFEWAKNMGGTYQDFGRSVATDRNGNVYITGYFSALTNGSQLVDFNIGDTGGTLTLSTLGVANAFIAKYDADGSFLWAKNVKGTGNSYGYGVATDSSGNVYVTGYFTSTVDCNPGGSGGTLLTEGGADVFIAKYDTRGNYLWAKHMGSARTDYGHGVAVDGSGNAYVTGVIFLTTDTANFNPGGDGGKLTGAGGYDVFLAKYDAGGNYLWAKTMGGTGADYGQGVAVDGSGNAYVTGYFPAAGANFNPNGSGGTLTSAGNNDVFLAKYDAGGNFLWAKNMGGTGADNSYGVAATTNGNVYVSGHFSAAGAKFNPNGSGGTLTSLGGQDVFLAKYDAGGNYLWAKNMGGISGDVCYGVAVDGSGNAYVTGAVYRFTNTDTVYFNPGGSGGKLTSGDVGIASTIFIAKYDVSGNYSWGKIMGGNSNIEYGYGIAVDGKGNVYGTGYFRSDTINFNPGGSNGKLANISFLEGNIFDDIFLVKLSNCTNDNSITKSTCDSFTYNGTTYKESGIYSATFTNVNGCDSAVTLNLTINHAVSVNDDKAICNNQLPYTWNGKTITAGGNGVATVKLTASMGCDSTVTLNLSVNSMVTATDNRTICSNQLPFHWNGKTINAGGNTVATATLTNVSGCDSIVTLNLTVNNTATGTENRTICSNQLPYHWNGKTINAGGTGAATATLTNIAGCDSVVTLNLTVNNTVTGTENRTICSNQLPYHWNGKTINAGGNAVATATLTNSVGCDSVVTLNLTVNNTVTGTENRTICSNQLPYPWFGKTINAGGNAVATATLTNTAGCDSVVTLNLTVNDTVKGEAHMTICNNAQLPYNWYGQSINAIGDAVATHNFTSASGCDSLVTLSLAIDNLSAEIMKNEFVLTTTQSYSTYQWILNAHIIPGATQSAYTVTENGDYQVAVSNERGCTDTSDVFKVSDYTTGVDAVKALAQQIHIYPNPANNMVYIESPVSVNIALTDMAGRLIKKQDHATSVSVRALAQGIYLLHITDEKGVQIKVEKLIKAE